ncbi:hypothetical protein PFISCL1PPCAC_20070, partial [Pristionchus fissidentatus]
KLPPHSLLLLSICHSHTLISTTSSLFFLQMRLWLLSLSFLPFLQSQDPCADAPTAAAKIVCRQLNKWDANAREASTKKAVALPPGVMGGLAAELAPIAASIYQCLEIGCMCTYLRGTASNGGCTLSNGQTVRKAIRKEYRVLSEDERERLHKALNELKRNGEYSTLARIHAEQTRGGAAHSGPAFLPWHREYIKRVELALRQIDPTLALPYWDSTLDGALPKPADSIMFSDDFGGVSTAGGEVQSGPFANWRTLEGRANIKRAVGAQGSCFTDTEIGFIMRQTDPNQVLAFTAPQKGCPVKTDYNCLEYTHGNVHIFVGGDMFDTETSANDPLFYFHHSFVDFIWDMWRQQKQSRQDRETTYPLDNQQCASPQHFGASVMQPFGPFRNNDGLSNSYTDNMYEYAPRPTCPACSGSKYLFCDNSHGNPRCASKIKVGGVCTGFTRGEQPCHNGVCQNGRCVASGPVITRPPVTQPPVTPPPPVQVQESCFNENECCATWAAKGECTRNAAYMRDWCKAACRSCVPKTYSMTDDCRDRHLNCASWVQSGECSANGAWMTENCRKSCNKCGRSRAQSCGGGGGEEEDDSATTTTTVRPQQQCSNSAGCFNENQCCAIWGMMGECTRNPSWMACNCRVSCGHCYPQDYYYGGCDDYHPQCSNWARRGECQRNPWMLENCRTSCRSCKSQQQLRGQCSTGQSNQGQRTRGGWGFSQDNWGHGGRDNGGWKWNGRGNEGGTGTSQWGFGDDFWGRKKRE